jgi:NADH:ubiquinone oxidoreductase subunit E
VNEQQPRLRLFVCTKVRTDGRSCCSNRGSSLILDELRRQLLCRGEACSHLDVQPSGCLDRCEEGPVVKAFVGQLAEEPAPSKELIKAHRNNAAHTFTAVAAGDISAILDTVLGE